LGLAATVTARVELATAHKTIRLGLHRLIGFLLLTLRFFGCPVREDAVPAGHERQDALRLSTLHELELKYL